jgi:DNA-binding transcriptional LysR family regulator
MDLRQLRYFVCVAETESVARAAALLHISQSPLSRQILQLESVLGLPLFERSKQRLHLTTEGRTFLEEARDLLAHAAQVREHAMGLGRGQSGRLVVGYVDGAMHSGVLALFLRRFQQAHPRVRLELVPLRSTPQAEGLMRGTLDVGFVYTPAEDRPELATRRIFSESLQLVLPRDHPLTSARAIRPADLDGAAWIALSRTVNPAWRDKFLATCHRAGFTPDIRFETTQLATVLGLVEAGLGLALVQQSAHRAAPPGVVFRPLRWFRARVQIHLSWRRTPERPMARRFVDAVADANAGG